MRAIQHQLLREPFDYALVGYQTTEASQNLDLWRCTCRKCDSLPQSQELAHLNTRRLIGSPRSLATANNSRTFWGFRRCPRLLSPRRSWDSRDTRLTNSSRCCCCCRCCCLVPSPEQLVPFDSPAADVVRRSVSRAVIWNGSSRETQDSRFGGCLAQNITCPLRHNIVDTLGETSYN